MGAVKVVGHLGHLAGGNQGTYRAQTAIPRRKVRTQPLVAEQNIRGVLHNPGNAAPNCWPTRCTIRFRRFVKRKERNRRRGQLIARDLALREDVFCDGNGRYCVRPAGVERQMRDDLGNFGWLHTVIER
jgi:hypothetical protein